MNGRIPGIMLLGVSGNLKRRCLVGGSWVTTAIIFWLSEVLEISVIPKKVVMKKDTQQNYTTGIRPFFLIFVSLRF